MFPMKKSLPALLLAGALAASAFTVVSFAQTNSSPTPAPAQSGAKKERHPAIRAAIRALQSAKIEMQNAAHDFGGHRAAALAECDKAIAQLQLALQYDK
jgi:hypothetical protein